MSEINLDSTIASFETAFAVDSSADIRDFVPASSDARFLEIVTELIRVDMELRVGTTQRKTIEDYALLFPAITREKSCLEQIAFEEYRLRVVSGEEPSPLEYKDRFSINVDEWPYVSKESDAGDTTNQFQESEFEKADAGNIDADRITQPDLAARIVDGQIASMPTAESTLHTRLKFISLAILVSLVYFSILVFANPVTKVGLFLGSEWLYWLNGFCLIVCFLICIALFVLPEIRIGTLRIIELVLFGSVLAELSCGLASDLFLDRELSEPISKGDHALFHYASSWSLPFFALIVAYGTLVPSSWRRCTIIVSLIAILPILICTVAVVSFHGFSFSFFQSFFMQMLIWMSTACLIAIFGVRRLEQTENRMSKFGDLGKYRLIRRIAVGGMGQVFLAEHAILKRQCAVKLLHPKWSSDSGLLRRFEREVQVLAGISHPNIVQVYDFGFTNDGGFYYVMELLKGNDLRRVIADNGPMRYDQIISLMLQIAKALHVIHDGGIVHRDLTPGNVFLCESDGVEVAKLLDFGLLKAETTEQDQQLTQVGAIIGTPAYMSPEQAAGRKLDHRTDIYSLGAVAYFARYGRPVFERSSSVETLNDHIRSAPSFPIMENEESIPPKFQEIVSRCLAKDPRCRFQSALELEMELQNISLVEPVI